MKVLHVIAGLGLGGAEGMLTALLLRAPAPGVTAAVATLLPGGENARRLREGGIAVSDLGMRRGVPDPGAILGLARLVRRWRPDVVQSWMYHADLLASLALGLVRPRPALVWGVRCSDMDPRRYGPALRLVIFACARLSRRPDAVLANSASGWRVHEARGYRPRRVEIVPNGIDLERFRPDAAARAALRAELAIPSGAIVAAHVARRDPMKDHETLLSAVERVPGLVTLLIGLGTEDLPAHPATRRLGARADVARLLAAADIVVSSSAFGEGFSNALAEGMAVGLAPVATDVGDARAILGETGPVVPPCDPEALARALESLLAEGEAGLARRGAAARARIAGHFPLARAAERYAALYRSLV